MFWDKRARKYDARVTRHDELYDKTIAQAGSLLAAGDVVLDFGCASGEMSLELASYAQQVNGIDSSPKMIELARRHRTAVMCASLLRYNPMLLRFGQRLADIAPVTRIDVPSVGPSLAGVFHAVATAKAVMGYGCEWVQSMGPDLFGVMQLHFPGPEGGTDVFIFNSNGQGHAFIKCGDCGEYCDVCLSTTTSVVKVWGPPPAGEVGIPAGSGMKEVVSPSFRGLTPHCHAH